MRKVKVKVKDENGKSCEGDKSGKDRIAKSSSASGEAMSREEFVARETVRIYRIRVAMVDLVHTQMTPRQAFSAAWDQSATAAAVMADKLGWGASHDADR